MFLRPPGPGRSVGPAPGAVAPAPAGPREEGDVAPREGCIWESDVDVDEKMRPGAAGGEGRPLGTTSPSYRVGLPSPRLCRGAALIVVTSFLLGPVPLRKGRSHGKTSSCGVGVSPPACLRHMDVVIFSCDSWVGFWAMVPHAGRWALGRGPVSALCSCLLPATDSPRAAQVLLRQQLPDSAFFSVS